MLLLIEACSRVDKQLVRHSTADASAAGATACMTCNTARAIPDSAPKRRRSVGNLRTFRR